MGEDDKRGLRKGSKRQEGVQKKENDKEKGRSVINGRREGKG